MPKRRSQFDSRLNEIVSDHVQELVNAISAAVRQNMANELREYLGSAATSGNGRLIRRGRRKRVLACIAPGCKNQSKGPRFHYLCDNHKDAPKKDYEAWRKARRDKASA